MLLVIFGIEDVAKGDFPHHFNQPKFQHYHCLIPALKWYDPDTKSSKKRQELIEWQVAKEVFFDFQEKMQWYCHMDVTVLCLWMNNFWTIFQNLKTLIPRFLMFILTNINY